MLESLLSAQNVTYVRDATPIDFSALSSRTWAGADTTATAELAPNGDECQVWGNTGASSKLIDLTSRIGTGRFTIGAYFKPSSFQPQYGTEAPTAWVFQLGPFGNSSHVFAARPGTGTGANLTNTLTGPLIDTHVTPVGVWTHLAFSFDPGTGKILGFTNGQKFGEGTADNPASRILSIGGIGDRSGVVGANNARYGYRGLVSAVRFTTTLQTADFNPLTW